jgi:hypothetical protein
MQFARLDEVKKMSEVLSLNPKTAPHNGLAKGGTVGMVKYTHPSATGKGLAAASVASIAAAQASSPEKAVGWTYAGAYVRQGKQAA